MRPPPKEAERTVAAKFVRLSSERQWQEGLEEQRVGWSSLERKVMGAVEDYLEKCVNTEVDIEALERLWSQKTKRSLQGTS